MITALLFKLIASASACTNHNFFGLVPWYKYLTVNTVTNANSQSVCSVSFNVIGGKSSIPLILLAVVDDLLRIAGLVTIGFVIYGAIQFIVSQGNPDDTSKAQSTIINALIGLAVTIVAIAFVSFLGNKIGS